MRWIIVMITNNFCFFLISIIIIVICFTLSDNFFFFIWNCICFTSNCIFFCTWLTNNSSINSNNSSISIHAKLLVINHTSNCIIIKMRAFVATFITYWTLSLGIGFNCNWFIFSRWSEVTSQTLCFVRIFIKFTGFAIGNGIWTFFTNMILHIPFLIHNM